MWEKNKKVWEQICEISVSTRFHTISPCKFTKFKTNYHFKEIFRISSHFMLDNCHNNHIPKSIIQTQKYERKCLCHRCWKILRGGSWHAKKDENVLIVWHLFLVCFLLLQQLRKLTRLRKCSGHVRAYKINHHKPLPSLHYWSVSPPACVFTDLYLHQQLYTSTFVSSPFLLTQNWGNRN